MRFTLEKALAIYNSSKDKDERLSRTDLAKLIWTEKTLRVQQTNMNNLLNGHVKSIKFSILDKICRSLECKPNDLFS